MDAIAAEACRGFDPFKVEMLESLFVDSCFYPAERARSGPDE